ncbi:MAG: hypothetical protein Q4G70_16200 [Pseudomonadota bacterium]|nr:hypothetical protein [Pseudomonadota bacterium]
MRVNARFDAEAEQQVTYLAEVTGMGVSEVLRTSVQHYYDLVRAQRGGLKHLGAFIGQADSGRSDVAGTYKVRLDEGWAAKHGGHAQPGPAVHEPPSPRRAGQGKGGA